MTFYRDKFTWQGIIMEARFWVRVSLPPEQRSFWRLPLSCSLKDYQYPWTCVAKQTILGLVWWGLSSIIPCVHAAQGISCYRKCVDPSWSHLCLCAFLTCSLGGVGTRFVSRGWLTVLCAVVSLKDPQPAPESIFFLWVMFVWETPGIFAQLWLSLLRIWTENGLYHCYKCPSPTE